MVEQKEIEEFGMRLGGALLGATEDAILEAAWKRFELSGKFPYIEVHEKLPPVDDLIVGGLSIPCWVFGVLTEEDGKERGDVAAQARGKQARQFGEGNICYSIPMVIHHTLARVAEPKIWAPGKRVSTGSKGQRSRSGARTLYI